MNTQQYGEEHKVDHHESHANFAVRKDEQGVYDLWENQNPGPEPATNEEKKIGMLLSK